MTIVWTRRASRQYLAAIESLEEVRPGSGAGMESVVDRILDRIEHFPAAFHRAPVRHRGEVRQAVVLRFRYLLIYKVQDASTVVVLGFMHGRREPGSWQTH